MHFMSPYVFSKQEETLMACPPQTVCRHKHRIASAAATPSSEQFVSATTNSTPTATTPSSRVTAASATTRTTTRLSTTPIFSNQSAESIGLHRELSKLFEFVVRRRKARETESSSGVLYRKLWRKLFRLQRNQNQQSSKPNDPTTNTTECHGNAIGDSSKSISKLLRRWRLLDFDHIEQQRILSGNISTLPPSNEQLQLGFGQQQKPIEIHRFVEENVSGIVRDVEGESNSDFTTGCGVSSGGRGCGRGSNACRVCGSTEYYGLCISASRTDYGPGTQCDCLSFVGLVRLEKLIGTKARTTLSKRKGSRLRMLQSKSLESPYITR